MFCTFCDKCFAKKHLLKHQMRLHTANIHTEMSEALDKKSELKEEVKVSYICETCGMDCQCVSAYMQHEKSHKKKEKKLLSCHICRKEFKFNSLLLHHVESHKPKNKAGKSLSCLTCGKKYSKTGSLTKHELQHEGKGSFRCRPCGEVFGTEAERAKHRDEKHEKPWKCTVCNHMFASEQKLDSHVKWHESKEAEVFVCNVCDKEFKLKVNLKVHVESRCGMDPQHVCKVCGKAFMTRGTLVTHTLLHTGEKTFLCRFCGKSYRLKVEMQRHERSHTGEKPFVCQVCNKAFAHRESLVTHNTLHTGVRPYMCEACGSTFSCIGNLIKHKKTHRNRCALVTPTVTSNKPRVKSTTSQLQTHEKNMTRTKLPTEHTSLVLQGYSNNEEAPVLSGSYCGYKKSNYEENHDWISPIFSSSDKAVEQSVADERFCPIADLHLTSMERNIRSTQYCLGSASIMGLPPDAMQSFGMCSAVSKELKPKSTRSLPYPFSADGKPTVSSTLQNLDNHKHPNHGSEKYPYDYGFQSADTEKSCFIPKAVADLFQQHSTFKPVDHVAQNIIPPQRESGYKSNSGCGNHLSSMMPGPENDSMCDDDDFVANHFTIPNLVNNLKSSGTDDKLSNPALKTDSEETEEMSNTGSDSVLSETGVTTSEVKIKCNYTVNKDSEVDVINVHDDEKLVFETIVTCSSKKMPRERKQKYPARCDMKSEESETTSSSKSVGDCPESHFSCVSCGLDFVQEHLLSEHVQSHLGGGNRDDSVNGDGCKGTGVASDEDEPLDKRLERHLQKAEVLHSEVGPRKYLCQYCNKYFDFVSQLNRHRKCHSSEEKEATPCRHCGKKYTNRACLIKHESQHTSVGVFKCKQCGDGFNSKQEYRAHRAKQHGKQWSCTDCQRSFSNSSNLKNHYNNKHLGREAKSYACNVCGKLFKQKGNLKVHVDSRCGSEPRHVCNICGKAFMSGGSLGTHLLLHTGVKTFLCRFCGKSYRLKVEMQRHERSHTGEKPFVCQVCNKAFAHRESLVTHNTLHTGVRPYMCEACGSTFSCIGNLIKHRQTHNRRCDVARQ